MSERMVANSIMRYGSAVAGCLVALLLSRLMYPVIDGSAFDFFLAAVFLTALLGGLRPALFAAALSIIALDYFFISPLYSLTCGATDVLKLFIFGLVAVLTSGLSTRLKRIEIERTTLEISNREQRRLGQDLHDGLCQLLAGTKMLVGNIGEKVSSPDIKEDIALIESRLNEALRQTDTLARGLYPAELESNGLQAALEEMAAKISRVYPVRCRFETRGKTPFLNSSDTTHLFRIAQEALINALKSGKADSVGLKLLGRKGSIILAIADNGIGFQKNPRKGMGLKMMQDRAHMLSADLIIRPGRQKGTMVICKLARGSAIFGKEVPI